jgi:hypothetical protein
MTTRRLKAKPEDKPDEPSEADRFRAVLDAVRALPPSPMRTAIWAAIIGEGLVVRNHLVG